MFRDITLHLGELVSLWGGPYVVFGYGREYTTLYTLTKLDEKPAKDNYHGDHLKKFWLREGYLVPLRVETFEIYTKMQHKIDEVRLQV